MFCDHCGASVNPGQNFCSRCGKQLAAAANPPAPEPPHPPPPRSAPLPPIESRVERHLKIVAILWLVVSIFGLLPALGFFFGGGIAMHFVPFPMRAFFLPIAGFIAVLLLGTAVGGLLAGWGLLNYRPWARVLGLVLGVISLLHFPFGTALGIYTLWVLLPAESEREYRRLAGASY
jgi:zinc-ribbon domain